MIWLAGSIVIKHLISHYAINSGVLCNESSYNCTSSDSHWATASKGTSKEVEDKDLSDSSSNTSSKEILEKGCNNNINDASLGTLT